MSGTSSLCAGSTNPGNITLTNDANDFGGAVAASGANNVAITDANSLSLGAIGIDGDLIATANTGALTVSGTIGATHRKSIDDTLWGSGSVALKADEIVVGENASVIANKGITIQSVTQGKGITLGTGTSDLHLSDADLAKLSTTGTLQIGDANAGTITVDSALAQTGKAIKLITNRDINLNAAVASDSLTLVGSAADNNFNIGSMDGMTNASIITGGGTDGLAINDQSASVTDGYTYDIADATANTPVTVARRAAGDKSAANISFSDIGKFYLTVGPGGGVVNSTYLTGVEQDLTGSMGRLNFDCLHTVLATSASPLRANGSAYGQATYRNFASVNAFNAVSDEYTSAISSAQRQAISTLVAPTSTEGSSGSGFSPGLGFGFSSGGFGPGFSSASLGSPASLTNGGIALPPGVSFAPGDGGFRGSAGP